MTVSPFGRDAQSQRGNDLAARDRMGATANMVGTAGAQVAVFVRQTAPRWGTDA